MQILQLSLVNFKNIANAELLLGKKFNCFVGNNGSGKTTILDALHYLSVCKSFLNAMDTQNISHEQPFFLITGTFERNGESEAIHCAVKREGKKLFKRNRKEYQRLVDHVGLLPSVIISPADGDLISGGSDVRRKFLDGVLAQLDRNYLEQLLAYNKVLAQRNALLKSFSEGNPFDGGLLEVWDIQLAERGERIHAVRAAFFESFRTAFQSYYKVISGGMERVDIIYQSPLDEGSMLQLLSDSLVRDRATTHTTVGIHKDDVLFTLEGYPLRKFASQGQQKSMLVALKLAQYAVMNSQLGLLPLLLLDDIFDKLDDNRVSHLLDLVGGPDFGQIMITDTHPKRIAELLRGHEEVKVFNVSSGQVESSKG